MSPGSPQPHSASNAVPGFNDSAGGATILVMVAITNASGAESMSRPTKKRSQPYRGGPGEISGVEGFVMAEAELGQGRSTWAARQAPSALTVMVLRAHSLRDPRAERHSWRSTFTRPLGSHDSGDTEPVGPVIRSGARLHAACDRAGRTPGRRTSCANVNDSERASNGVHAA
jgi:hypothetical protein